ncbi:MAG: hypothetical protein OHK0046_47150 [Anaerolineae bacterium]
MRIVFGIVALLAFGLGPALAQEETTEEPLPSFTATLSALPQSPEATLMPLMTATEQPPTEEPPTATPAATFTPRPDVPDFIFNWAEEVIYPQAVRFTLTVNRPISEISALVLNIRAQGEPNREIQVNVAENAVTASDTFTDFVFLWRIPASNPLPFQAAIDYDWLVVLTSNASARVPGAFYFGDPNISWVVDSDPNGVLDLIYPRDTVNAALLRQSIQPVYDLLVANTGTRIGLSLALTDREYPFDPCDSPRQEPVTLFGPRSGTQVTCANSVLDGVLRQLGYTAFPVTSITGAPLQPAILETMVNAFYGSRWQALPVWFREGVTTFYTPGDKTDLIFRARQAFRVQPPYTLEQMNNPETVDLSIWQAQSYGMVLYMAELASVERLFVLANGIEGSFEDAYETAIGQPLEALLPNWTQWIYSGVAVADAQLSLYQGATAIPSPTITVTLFPPSETPTATRTPTATFTATPFGFRLTATPLPSLTPTRTPTPRPATVTPRPAGFVDATPVPAVVNTGDDNGGSVDRNVVVAGAGAAVLVALAIIGYVILSMRRGNPGS